MSNLTPSQLKLMQHFCPDVDTTKKCSICNRGLYDSGCPLPPRCDVCGQTDYCVGCSTSVYQHGVMTYQCMKHIIGIK